MSKKKREQLNPLTRWAYFRKNLYQNTANSANFCYDKVIYQKSEELQAIDSRSQRVNYLLILSLVVMFFVTTWFQNIYIVVAYLFFVAGGQVYRFCLLPRDITRHLTDTGYRER